MKHALALCAALTILPACEETGGRPDATDAGTDPDAAVDFSSGTQLQVDVVRDQKTYVNLGSASVVGGDGTGWDLAFVGYDVFTNSGPSGPGGAAAFGPLPAPSFLLDEAPVVPFMSPDKTGGAFLGWYFYDGSTHYLWSRLHTFGVKDGDRLWKVQVLTYYGERNGGPVSALYNLRYAELNEAGAGPTRSIQLDGTAGGAAAPPGAAGGCLDLDTGTVTQLTPTEAVASSAWHLCARRDTISVNGGVSGPRGVTSADLEGDKIAVETLADVKARTAESQAAAFDGATRASFAPLTFLPDGIVSAFRDLWVDRTAAPPARGTGAWLVQSASSAQQYLVAFPEFQGATAETPTKITVSIKKVGGT